MNLFIRYALVALLCAAQFRPASGEQISTQKSLTLEGAQAVIAAAISAAQKVHAPGGAISVVDAGGNVIALDRMDNTFAAAWHVSIGKARTAALFKKPTSFFENAVKNGRVSLVAMDDFTPLQGGVPIEVGDQIVGAIGVSGMATAQQDEDVALAGAAALK